MRTIGFYQIISGCLGLVVFLWAFYASSTSAPAALIVTLIALLLSVFSIFAGYHCVKMKNNALTLSLINQGIQLVGFNIVGYSFLYATCLNLSVGVDLTESFKFTFQAGLSDLAFSINTHSDVIAVNLNIVALLIFAWLGNINKRIKVERESALFE